MFDRVVDGRKLAGGRRATTRGWRWGGRCATLNGKSWWGWREAGESGGTTGASAERSGGERRAPEHQPTFDGAGQRSTPAGEASERFQSIGGRSTEYLGTQRAARHSGYREPAFCATTEQHSPSDSPVVTEWRHGEPSELAGGEPSESWLTTESGPRGSGDAAESSRRGRGRRQSSKFGKCEPSSHVAGECHSSRNRGGRSWNRQ